MDDFARSIGYTLLVDVVVNLYDLVNSELYHLDSGENVSVRIPVKNWEQSPFWYEFGQKLFTKFSITP